MKCILSFLFISASAANAFAGAHSCSVGPTQVRYDFQIDEHEAIVSVVEAVQHWSLGYWIGSIKAVDGLYTIPFNSNLTLRFPADLRSIQVVSGEGDTTTLPCRAI